MNLQAVAKSGVRTAVLGLTLVSAPAWSTILLVASNVATISDTVGPYPATSVMIRSFATTVPNQLVRVIYNAECAIDGPTTNWLNDDILIDGVVLPPSNSDNALCSGNGTAGLDGWTSVVTQVYARVPNAGVHTINVIVQPSVATGWRIDDQSLVIDTQ